MLEGLRLQAILEAKAVYGGTAPDQSGTTVGSWHTGHSSVLRRCRASTCTLFEQ
jgi:hypothetical protein